MFTFGSVNDRVDTITDFNVNEDVMDLRVIFNQPQYSGATPYVRYLQSIKLLQVGSNVEVKIDADGNGSGTTFVAIALLQNVSTSALTGRNFVIS
jgi:large repetitive protein